MATTLPTPAPDTDFEDAGHPRRWLILGVLVLSLIVVVLDNTVLNVAMKTLADPNDGIGATQSQLAWLINSYTLVFAGLLFAFGVIGDRIGRKRMLLIGLVIFGVASLLSAYAVSPENLLLYRAIKGVGAAAMMPATLALVRAAFSHKEFPKALGVWTGAVGIGSALGPIVGGALLERFWWGSVFLINVPIVIFSMIMIVFFAPESKGVQGKPDLVGMGLSVAGLVSLTYGIINAGNAGSWSGVGVIVPIVAGLIILAAFVVWERRIPHASLDMSLFTNPRFSASAAIIALTFFGMMGLFFFMTFYLQIVKGFTPLQAGLLFLPTGVALLIFSPLSNAMVNRFGPRVVGVGALLLIIGSFFVVTMLDADTPVGVLIALFFVQGTGMAHLMPPAMNTLMSSVPREKAGVGSALGNTLRQVGGSFGVAVLGTVMAQGYRSRIEEGAPELPDAARESIAATFGLVEQGGAPAGVMDAASEAFIGAMHTTAYSAIGAAVVGLIVVILFFPTKRQTNEAPTPTRAPGPAMSRA
ncbi:DHA2 family efflux MFS transporter permease subunit [Hoyosella altamirensis]|uniref:EmrB/QacA subfamily drug resistance transporter n=1 Tax=Hoyosella altamirensis TaxID=616997 RepID=A0A839RP35_9ACTN|nr:DHA2 family efflux MFS transporter permease subunit [Hoyosella altamirensis]MBB3038762.1 EmrB/QacA subfamily drug resistance transporter [Hoyosella altamirensis]